MDQPIQNMRVRFYGVQGSSSTFPSSSERNGMYELMGYRLLRAVFEDLSRYTNREGRLDCTLEEIVGGEIGKKSIRSYQRRLNVPKLRIYGGWTTCVHVETAEGVDIVFDCGSGFRNCAQALQKKWGDRKERHLYIFGSHSHVDHTEGFDLSSVCFDPRNTLHIYGNAQFLAALDNYLGIFTRHVAEEIRGVQTPVYYSLMPARFEGIELRDLGRKSPPNRTVAHRIHDARDAVQIGSTSIKAFEVYHPAPCLAYRVEHGGKVFVFCTDHELRHGSDPADPRQIASLQSEKRVIEHAQGVELLYRDAQYLRSEYDGNLEIGSSAAVPRIDWGHSCIEDVEEMAVEYGIKQTFIGHHDPNRDWNECNWIDEALARRSSKREEKVAVAQAETTIDL